MYLWTSNLKLSVCYARGWHTHTHAHAHTHARTHTHTHQLFFVGQYKVTKVEKVIKGSSSLGHFLLGGNRRRKEREVRGGEGK